MKILPKPSAVITEGIVILGGTLLAAWVISRLPAVQKFVQQNSLTVRDTGGNVLY